LKLSQRDRRGAYDTKALMRGIGIFIKM